MPNPDDRRLTWNRRAPTTGAARARLRQQADRLYRSGLSMKHVGEKIDRSQHTVQRLLREMGTPIRPRTGRTLDHRPMVELHQRIPAHFHDQLAEYAKLRGIPYNDAVIDCLGRGLGEKWAGRRQPGGKMK